MIYYAVAWAIIDTTDSYDVFEDDTLASGYYRTTDLDNAKEMFRLYKRNYNEIIENEGYRLYSEYFPLTIYNDNGNLFYISNEIIRYEVGLYIIDIDK